MEKTLARRRSNADSRCTVHCCNSTPSVQISCGHWFCNECAFSRFSNSNQTCPRADCGKVVEKIEDTFEELSYLSYLTGEEKEKCQPSNHDWQYLVGTSDLNVAPFEHESQVQEPHLSTYQGTAADDDTFLDNHGSVAERKKYTCPECGYLLRDAVQTICGHWFCLDCAVNLFEKSSTPVFPCPECGETLEIEDGKEFFPDQFVRKEISKFQVRCRYFGNNCQWTGTLVEQLKHLEVCIYEQEECPHCNSMFSKSEIIEHEGNCPKALVFCSRMSLMENSNYDGTMLWKVPQFTQRMDDARTGKYTSILSLPFYSGRYGYKMCLRLYILGDGIGKGSHMSLFFVLMKGEFDNILQWPFNHKVTFELINQCGGRDVVDVFQPNPFSSSFQKPKTNMNIASGCPRFVSLNELMQNGFVIDDKVFIKVKVETTRRKHP